MWYFATPETIGFLFQLLGNQLHTLGVDTFLMQIILLGKIPGTSFEITFTQIATLLWLGIFSYGALRVYRNSKFFDNLDTKRTTVRH